MKAHTFDVGLRQVYASQVRSVAIRIAHVSLAQIRVSQIRSPQIRARQIHTLGSLSRLVELLNLSVSEQQYERPLFELAHGTVIGSGGAGY